MIAAGQFGSEERRYIRDLYDAEVGDADALAAALRTVLMDDALRAAMGVAGAKRAREMFSWERFVERWLDQYKAIASPQC